MERVGSGRAKLLLLGEHSAVYGFPSVGLGLPESTELGVVFGSAAGWRAPGLAGEAARRFDAFLAYCASFLPGLAGAGGTIRISSSVPVGVGLGSSSALCVALARAFADQGSAEGELWEIAHRAEAFFHGSPSGIDTGLSLLGGLRSFRPSPPRPPAPPSLPATRLIGGFPLHLVLGAVPRPGGTASRVQALRQRIGAGDAEAMRLVETLGESAERAIELLEAAPFAEESARGAAERLAEFGTILGRSHMTLGLLGLGDPSVDRLLRAGLELGAVGGKQSGAGKGGAFFLVYPTRSAALAATEALAGLARAERIPLSAPLRALDWP